MNRRTLLVGLVSTPLVACTTGGALSLLTGGGPNVAANTQAGKTNTQTLGQNNINEQKIVRPKARSIEQSAGNTSVRSENVERVVVNEVDPMVLGVLMLLAGFLIPSPSEIGTKIRTWVTNLRKGD